MRYTTRRVYDLDVRVNVSQTTLQLDCGHQFIYFGPPEGAEVMLKDCGGSIAGHMSRCKECTDRCRALVQENIRQAQEAYR